MSVLALLACVGAASARAAKIDVGDGAKRNDPIALKTEAGGAYVLGLSAEASCEYDDEGEPVPPTFGLSAFPAPRTMRLRSRGFSAAETNSNGAFDGSGRAGELRRRRGDRGLQVGLQGRILRLRNGLRRERPVPGASLSADRQAARRFPRAWGNAGSTTTTAGRRSSSPARRPSSSPASEARSSPSARSTTARRSIGPCPSSRRSREQRWTKGGSIIGSAPAA